MTVRQIKLHILKNTSAKILYAMENGTLDCFNPHQLSMDNFIIRDTDWHISLFKPAN